MSIQVTNRYNLVVAVREYEKDGEKKKVWKTIGELTRFKPDEGEPYLKAELFHMPGVQISVYEQKEKDSNF